MTWTSGAPDGAQSVKANRLLLTGNMNYIENTMGNSVVGSNGVSIRDHFWDVSSNVDGRHRFIQSPAFTVASLPADPDIGTGMDGVLYLKTTNNQAQWFNKNVLNVYQATPNFLQGTVIIGSGYTIIVAIPTNVYGEIFMWQDVDGATRGQAGFFKSNASFVDAWSYGERINTGSSTNQALARFNVTFENGNSNSLNIRGRSEVASSGSTWNYRITYRAI